MELANPPGRELERAALGRRQRAARRLHLRGPHAQTRGRELHTIEAGAEFDQRAVAAPAHRGYNLCHRGVDRGAVAAAPLHGGVEKPAKSGAPRTQNCEFHLISSHLYAASSSGTRTNVAPSARRFASTAS